MDTRDTATITAGRTRRRRTRRVAVTGAALVLAPAVVLAGIFAGTGVSLIPGLPRSVSTVPGLMAEVLEILVGLLVVLVGCAVVARVDGHRRLRDLGWRWDHRSLPALVLGLAVAAAVEIGLGLPLTATGALRPGEAPLTGPLWTIVVSAVATGVLGQGIPEEVAFRGMALTTVRLCPIPAAIATSLVFGAMHLVSDVGQQSLAEHVIAVLVPLGFGLAAAALVLLTRSLWAGIGVHGGLHLADSGGTFLHLGSGPVQWTVTGFAYLAVGVVGLVLVHRRDRREGVPSR